MNNQINIKLNSKHYDLVNNFKHEILDLEGALYGNFGDYVAEAMELYLHYMKNFPEKIGKEKHTISNISKTRKRLNQFLNEYGDSLKPISSQGLDYDVFYSSLKKLFKKSHKTLKEYENDILREAQWSIIKVPGISKKLVLHRLSNLYVFVERFDQTSNKYYSGIKPTKIEKSTFKQIKERLLPTEENKQQEIEKEVDLIFNSKNIEEEEE